MRSTPAPARTEPAADPILAVREVSKRYGAVQALDRVSLELRPGSILALCGENGAGKSTLVRLLTGMVAPDRGELLYRGRPCRLGSPRDAQALGIAVVSQELSVCPDLSVLDNIGLGSAGVPLFHRRAGLRRRAREALDALGSDLDLDAEVGSLGLGERQQVEIARMLARDAQVLILDEPTATLTDVEIDRMFAALEALRRQGRAIVLVTHRLGEVFRICDRVVVLRNGVRVAERAADELDREALIELMLGRELAQVQAREPARGGGRLLVARGLCQPGVFGPLDLTLERGTIVALVGQLGAGANEVVRALAGLVPDATGEVSVDGRPLRLGSSVRALGRGVMFISGDRAREGIFQRLTVQDNLTATRLAEHSRGGLLRHAALRRSAAWLARQVGVDPRRLVARADELSGGNQQKLAFGRCIDKGGAGVLAMIEPTRGIDIGARADIYRTMRGFCDQGHALLVASSDLEEVAGISDVVITLFRGKLVAVYADGAVSVKQMLADITHPTGAPPSELPGGGAGGRHHVRSHASQVSVR